MSWLLRHIYNSLHNTKRIFPPCLQTYGVIKTYTLTTHNINFSSFINLVTKSHTNKLDKIYWHIFTDFLSYFSVRKCTSDMPQLHTPFKKKVFADGNHLQPHNSVSVWSFCDGFAKCGARSLFILLYLLRLTIIVLVCFCEWAEVFCVHNKRYLFKEIRSRFDCGNKNVRT